MPGCCQFLVVLLKLYSPFHWTSLYSSRAIRDIRTYTYSVCEFESQVPGSWIIGSTECSVPLSRAFSYYVRATNMSLPAFIICLDQLCYLTICLLAKISASYFLLSNIHEMNHRCTLVIDDLLWWTTSISPILMFQRLHWKKKHKCPANQLQVAFILALVQGLGSGLGMRLRSSIPFALTVWPQSIIVKVPLSLSSIHNSVTRHCRQCTVAVLHKRYCESYKCVSIPMLYQLKLYWDLECKNARKVSPVVQPAVRSADCIQLYYDTL